MTQFEKLLKELNSYNSRFSFKPAYLIDTEKKVGKPSKGGTHHSRHSKISKKSLVKKKK